jgi:hypothetical protein
MLSQAIAQSDANIRLWRSATDADQNSMGRRCAAVVREDDLGIVRGPFAAGCRQHLERRIFFPRDFTGKSSDVDQTDPH